MKGGHGATIQASHGCKPVGVSAANVSGITHSPTGEHSLGLEFKHSALSSNTMHYALRTMHYIKILFLLILKVKTRAIDFGKMEQYNQNKSPLRIENPFSSKGTSCLRRLYIGL